MKITITICSIILLNSLIFCHYTAIKTQRHLLKENSNLSSFLINETFSLNETNKTNTKPNETKKNLQHEKKENHPVFTMIKLYNFKDVQYSGDIYVGTPYTKYSVIYDTGSNLFWLPSVNCTLKCRNDTKRYNPNLSSSSKNLHIKKNISYAKGYIKGRLYKDKVALNKKSSLSFLYNRELSVDDFKILAAYKEKYLYRTIFDGIVGLGINDEGDIYNSLIRLLYYQNKISSPSFSFYLLSNKENTQNNISRLYIGDILENEYINNLFKNNTKYCYLPKNSEYWQCEAQTIKFELKDYNSSNNTNGKSKIINSKSGVIFDTGTSYTIIPKKDSAYIMEYFNTTLKKKCFITKFHQIICQCNSPKEFGSIKLHFDEENYYEIKFEDLINYNESYRLKCHFEMLVDKIDFGIWVIGDSSLSSSLVTFNMNEKKISFVQNINKLIDDNKIAKSILINQSWMSSSMVWIISFGVILVVIVGIIYIFK